MERFNIDRKSANYKIVCSEDKDKVNRTAFINPTEKGSLKMPNLNSMIATQEVFKLRYSQMEVLLRLLSQPGKGQILVSLQL